MADRPTGVAKRRNRVPLSCESCRIRKLKCDRQNPCLNCVSRDIQCVFASGAPKTRSRPNGGPSEDLRSKLQRLEQLVSVMAENGPHGANGEGLTQQETPPKTDGDSSASPTPDFEIRTGHLVDQAARGQHYVGPSSWEAILHDVSLTGYSLVFGPSLTTAMIADIREHFDELPYALEDRAPLSTRRNPALLGGVSIDVSYSELHDGLPTRTLADRLVARFFDVYDPTVPSRQMIHKPTFLKYYENLWATSENGFCPYLLAIMYSIFCLALQSYYRQGDEPSDLRGRSYELADHYRKRAAQCCLKSDITAPTQRAVEALLMCTICEYARLGEGFIGQWLILGILVRKALHMGLHRDPDEFTSLSPFEKEMRRRLWAHIWQIDMLFSFQLGLPNAIHMFKTNVASPINVFEEELTEDMTELPPARPSEENTPIGFTITKLKLMRALGAVVEHLNVLKGFSFEELSELNQSLKEAHAAIPEYLRMQPMGNSMAAPQSLRLQRLQLQLFYDKAACMLNRRFIAISTMKAPTCMKARGICVESALNILDIQERFEAEQCKWWLFYLTKHDFLLAVTILYLVLFTKRKESDQVLNPLAQADPVALDAEGERITECLQRARAAWERLKYDSLEARQACRMFDSMQSQLQSMGAETKVLHPPMVTLATQAPVDTSMIDLKLEDSMPPGNGMVSASFDPFPTMDADTEFPMFDWTSWENSIQLPPGEDLSTFWPT